jgi:hypothetical protein
MSIAILQQDRHSNITFKDFWFLSGFDVNPEKNHKHFNAILKCLSCWGTAIDVNPDKNHKRLNVILKTFKYSIEGFVVLIRIYVYSYTPSIYAF